MNWRNEFFNEGKLGKGSFGTVYKATHRLNGSVCAIKEVYSVDESAVNEIKILEALNHCNIVDYIGYYADRYVLAIVMEFADVGTLTDYRKSPSIFTSFPNGEYAMWFLLNQLSQALAYLHENHIMHRDLKPDNILCFKSTAVSHCIFKLADFGLAKLMSRNAQGKFYTGTAAGTPVYMAPEVLYRKKYTFSADMWSVGAIAYFWYDGKHLFNNSNMVLRWNGCISPISTCYSRNLNYLVRCLLQPNKSNRMNAASVWNLTLQYEHSLHFN